MFNANSSFQQKIQPKNCDLLAPVEIFPFGFNLSQNEAVNNGLPTQ